MSKNGMKTGIKKVVRWQDGGKMVVPPKHPDWSQWRPIIGKGGKVVRRISILAYETHIIYTYVRTARSSKCSYHLTTVGQNQDKTAATANKETLNCIMAVVRCGGKMVFKKKND